MNIIKDKPQLTIMVCATFIFGIISFFTQLQFYICTILSLLIIFGYYTNKLNLKQSLVIFIIFFAGYYNADFQVKDNDKLFFLSPKNNITINGQVTSILETNKPDKTKFHFKVNEIDTEKETLSVENSKTLVTLFAPKNVYSKIQIGDYLSLKGKLRAPNKSENPAQFNYAKYLQAENIFTTFFVENNNFKIIKKPKEFSWRFLQIIDNQRNQIISKHAETIKSPYLELLGGVVFGENAISPTDDLKNSFKISGLLHLLAASGLNVGLIFSIWFFIGKIFKLNYKINIIMGAILILIYTCMTGFSPSILRAALMLEFILLGKIIDRQADTIALISFVCFLMLLYNPSWICTISFQLSFLVTLGLLLSVPVINDLCKKLSNKFLIFLINTISIPIIAQIWILPVQMYYFNTFSTYSIFANIIVLPFITILSFFGFISSILALLPFIPSIIIKYLDLFLYPFLNITVHISDFISSLPYANFTTIQPKINQVFTYYLILFIGISFLKIKTKIKKILLLFLILFFTINFMKIPNDKLELTFFSVKNADSCLIKTPKNRYFIIDTGKKSFTGNFSDGDGIIAKYLLSIGIKKIDFIILSHFDNDHIGGTIGLLKKIKVNKIFVNKNTPTSETSKELFDFLNHNNIPYEIVKNNSILYTEPNFKIKALLNKSIDNENENSIINLINYKDFNALFMGDAGISGYQLLPNNIKINILKLGHHGAKNVIDTTSLQKINPDTVIISTGQNQYGHPHNEILNTLIENNTKYYRTDEKHAIIISTNGNIQKEKCYIPNKNKFENCN